MAKVATRNGFSTRLREALRAGLNKSGIRTRAIEIEAIPKTRLHRVYVIAKKFELLQPSERQDLIWRILSQEFDPDEQLQISMIYTVTPDEMPSRDDLRISRQPTTAKR